MPYTHSCRPRVGLGVGLGLGLGLGLGVLVGSRRRARRRALVRLFGDYMKDREMWNCQAELAALFELLGDGGGIDGHGAPDSDVDSVAFGHHPNPATLTP